MSIENPDPRSLKERTLDWFQQKPGLERQRQRALAPAIALNQDVALRRVVSHRAQLHLPAEDH